MIRKIEHLGIAVKDLEKAEETMARLLGSESYKRETVASENVITSFYEIGQSKLELLEAVDNKGAIAKYLEKNREGIHHIAFDVVDIHHEIERLTKEGFIFINDQPKKGADNKLIVFLHPKSTNGLLVELCQEIH
jgi:methylmalonyl-CoA/ethylmalonyl-CoA epimerase